MAPFRVVGALLSIGKGLGLSRGTRMVIPDQDRYGGNLVVFGRFPWMVLDLTQSLSLRLRGKIKELGILPRHVGSAPRFLSLWTKLVDGGVPGYFNQEETIATGFD